LSKLFLDTWRLGHLELVQWFFTQDEEEDIIDINWRDVNNKNWLFCAADGNGDNYDVVEFLLQKFTDKEKKIITSALLYFLEINNSLTTKLNSIKEIFKRLDLLDLSETDFQGNFH